MLVLISNCPQLNNPCNGYDPTPVDCWCGRPRDGVSQIEVLSPGTLTTVQDWPGRVGLWEVGVPPSGPMDDRSLRIGNRLLGNAEGAAGLEVTLTGPRLRFDAAARVAVTGAPLASTLDGEPMPQWRAFDVPAGGELKLGAIRGHGLRAYVLVGGGIAGPRVMGARAVFAAAKLGGAPLRKGDLVPFGAGPAPGVAGALASDAIPDFANLHTLRVLLGPHGAPDFLTADGLAELVGGSWTVHHHSDRTGIRLVGPRPRWARSDGGEAGLRPSNILDSAYSVGTVMLAGDMAVIVGVDGPSLGGFRRSPRWSAPTCGGSGSCARATASGSPGSSRTTPSRGSSSTARARDATAS